MSRARVAVVAALLALLVSGCAPGTWTVRSKNGAVSLSALTRSAWIDTGYFVDAPWTRDAAAWSLDETYWGVRRAGTIATGLDGALVSRWIGPAFAGELRSSGLGALRQAAYAVAIANAAGLKFSRAAIAELTGKLEVAGGYREDPTDNAPSWGATAVALRLLRAIKGEVPASVIRSVNTAVADQPAATSANVVVNQTVPQLEAYSLLPRSGRTVATQVVAAMVLRITRTLDGLPADPVTLALRADLAETLPRLGLDPSAVDARTCSVAGHSVLQEQNQEQLDVYAAELGCAPRPQINLRSPSASGWPAASVDLAGAMEATRAGLVLSTDEQRPGRQTAVTEWLAARTPPARTADPFERDAADALALDLGLRPRLPATRLTDRRQRASTSILVALDADLISRAPSVGSATVVADLRAYASALGAAKSLTLVDALALESVGRLLHRADFRRRARAQALRLRTASGDFAFTPRDSGASVSANAMGAWITGTRIETRALMAHGVCAHGVCADATKVSDGNASLAASALLKLCRVAGCGGTLPLFLV